MKRMLTSLLLVALLLPLAGVNAEEAILNPELLNIREHNLENGLQVLMLEDHSAPVLSYQVWFHCGSRNERPGITGISHMFEHMMFRGSNKYGPEEHSHMVKRNGGTLNAFTSEDMTVYFENIASDQLELVIHLEAERQANLNISEETMATERQVVAEERRVRTDNSLFGSAIEKLIISSYNAHPYSWPVIGWMSDIENWTVEDLKEYYRIHYAPNNATVVLVGDFDSDEAIKLFEKYYGQIPAQPKPREIHTTEPVQDGERRIYFHRPAQLPFLLASYHIPEAAHEDIPAIEVAQKILSDGESSRIYKRCVYEEQLAMFAGGQVDNRKDPGIFLTYIGVNQGVELEEAENSLFDTIEGMADNPPTERELQKAKNQLEADFIFGLQTVMGKGMAIGSSVIKKDGNYKAFIEEPDQYRAVTVEDVQRVVKTYFHAKNRTVVIVVPDNGMAAAQMGGES
ncbi:insulinase family protein [bacterium]|nr:insulinase family protein [bacterium]